MKPILFLLIFCAGISGAFSVAGEENISAETRVVILGAGTPNPDPYASGPALAIVVGDTPYLVDFGAGVVRQAEKARNEKGIEALRAPNLQYAFLTHLHSDHTIGYPDLILTPWAVDRKVSLKVFGPVGLKTLTDGILEAYAEDIRIRKQGLQPVTESGASVEVTEFQGDGLVYKDNNVTVEAFRVCHGEISEAYGYRFTTRDRVIVVTGDTTYCPALVEAARGADVLISEVYNAEWLANEKPPEWQAYHSRYHLSSYDLGTLAAEVKPGVLVLYHELNWGGTEEELLAQIRSNFDGVVFYGHDLDVF